jgi:hypothetical protein
MARGTEPFGLGLLTACDLLGHELVHVDQYRAGMTIFKYVWSTHGYDNSLYEKSACAEQDEIQKNLTNEHMAACTCRR